MILFGFPCVGKTSVGECIARKFQIPFVDTDRAIEEAFYLKTQRILTCRALAHEYGMPFFRALESQVIATLSPQGIIALGGGTILIEENYLLLKKKGPFIYLHAPFSLLKNRNLANSPLPAYIDTDNPQSSLQQLYAMRCPQYEKLADLTVPIANLSIDAAADLVIQHFVGVYGK